MRLTPADVHNVAFKKPSLGKRGYDEDEVDAFLDLVEAELTSLIEENNELRQQLAAYEAGHVQPADSVAVAAPPAPQQDAGGAQQIVDHAPVEAAPEHEARESGGLFTHADAPTAEQPVVAASPVEPQPVAEQPVAEQPAPVEPAAAPVPAPVAAAAPADHTLQAARLLGLAQETAERLTSEASAEAQRTRAEAQAESERMLTDARNESEQTLTSARSESEQTLTSARNESERMLSEAKNTSESMVADATAKAEATIRDSEIRAEATDREAQRKYSEVMTQLTTQRTSLENKIDGLRTYEREYRSRLKSWISDQLHQLDDSSGEGATEAPVAAAPGGYGTEQNG